MANTFADGIFKRILLDENISIKNAMKFVPWVSNDNTSASVQDLAWRRTGNKPLFQLMLTRFIDAYRTDTECDKNFVKYTFI